MRKIVTTEQNMFIALGIKADLSNRPTGPVLLLDEPLEAAGLRFTEIRLNNYAGYANHAPEGCTALTCLLLGGSYDWWKARKADGTYRQCKKEIIDKFIKIIESRFPETKGAIEVTDMATPLTYERYTASFEGSWMSVWKSRDGRADARRRQSAKIRVPNLSRTIERTGDTFLSSAVICMNGMRKRRHSAN